MRLDFVLATAPASELVALVDRVCDFARQLACSGQSCLAEHIDADTEWTVANQDRATREFARLRSCAIRAGSVFQCVDALCAWLVRSRLLLSVAAALDTRSDNAAASHTVALRQCFPEAAQQVCVTAARAICATNSHLEAALAQDCLGTCAAAMEHRDSGPRTRHARRVGLRALAQCVALDVTQQSNQK